MLLMPYPHAATVVGGPTLMALVDRFAGLKRAVITVDPPGAGCSARQMRPDLPEMLGCVEEALGACGVSGPVDILGHSQGGFVSLAFAIERPDLVRRLVLVGARLRLFNDEVRNTVGIDYQSYRCFQIALDSLEEHGVDSHDDRGY